PPRRRPLPGTVPSRAASGRTCPRSRRQLLPPDSLSPTKESLMRTVAAALLVALAVAPAARAADVKLDTEDQKTLYALGLALSRNLAAFNLTPAELQDIEARMTDGLFS